jgi:hypothetical protein
MDPKAALRYALEATRERVLRCVQDLSEEEAGRGVYGLSPVVWQVGHVAFTDGQLLQRAGGASPVPEGYASLFGTGTGGQAAYPPLQEVCAAFEAAHAALAQLLEAASVDGPVDGRHFRTVGEMVAFSAYHRGYHVGKMATLRSLLGKPRLFG